MLKAARCGCKEVGRPFRLMELLFHGRPYWDLHGNVAWEGAEVPNLAAGESKLKGFLVLCECFLGVSLSVFQGFLRFCRVWVASCG